MRLKKIPERATLGQQNSNEFLSNNTNTYWSRMIGVKPAGDGRVAQGPGISFSWFLEAARPLLFPALTRKDG